MAIDSIGFIYLEFRVIYNYLCIKNLSTSWQAKTTATKQLKHSIMKITPEMAKRWLERNIENNRKPKLGGITRYAADMRNGNWGLNTDAIAFDKNGTLFNGQNRLHAVIKSGETISAFVVFDFPLNNTDFLHLDNGIKRSFRDMIRTGYSDDEDVKLGGDIASCYIVLKYWTKNISPDMRIDFIKANRDIVRWAAILCRHSSAGSTGTTKKSGAARIPSIVAVAMMDAKMCGEDENMLSAFASAYLDNIFNELDQRQIDYVLELRGSKRFSSTTENLCIAKSYIKAFARHLTKRYVTNNDYPAPRLILREENKEE